MLPTVSEYQDAMSVPQATLRGVTSMPRGDVQRNTLGPMVWTGNYAVVFRFKAADARDLAVRCFLRDAERQERHYREVTQLLPNINLSCFLGCSFHSKGARVRNQDYPLLLMQWADGKKLKDHIENNLTPKKLKALADAWAELAAELERANIAHGDLHDANIFVAEDAKGALRLTLVDYDSLYLPGMQDLTLTIAGLPPYQHPKRDLVTTKHHAVDAFSALSIYVSLQALAVKPALWNERKLAHTDGLLFDVDDYRAPRRSKTFQEVAALSTELKALTNELAAMCEATDLATLPSLRRVLRNVGLGSEPIPVSEWLLGAVRSRTTAAPWSAGTPWHDSPPTLVGGQTPPAGPSTPTPPSASPTGTRKPDWMATPVVSARPSTSTRARAFARKWRWAIGAVAGGGVIAALTQII